MPKAGAHRAESRAAIGVRSCGRRGEPGPGRGTRLVAPAVALLLVLAGTVVSGAGAAFVGITGTTGNSFDAAAVFPDFPSAVVADQPAFYHRFEDPATALTAADSSGNGNPGVYGASTFAGWTGLWPMDENAGGTARDLSGAATTHDLTGHGTGWAAGRSGSALSFDGTSSYATSAAGALTSTASFSVAAWVYLSDTSVSRTAVSADGANTSGFELGYDSASNRWLFAMAETDSAAATVDKVTSGAAPALNTWTQLTATYNATSTGMDLYVNGVKQTGRLFAGTPWNVTGGLVAGAGLSAGRTHYWQGRVDQVRTHIQVVDAGVARELTIGPAGAGATSWQFDENTGTSSVDYSGHLNAATLGSTAAWGTAKSGAASIDLPGDADGYAAGTSPGADTTASFSVAAWVYLNHTTLTAMSRVVASQSGSVKSGFILRYNYVGKQWEFAVTTGAADDNLPAYDSSSSALNSAVLTTWTHLVGVYDASAQTVTLYVNGSAQAATAHTSAFNATGPLQAGRVKEFGAWQTGSAGNEAWGPWAGRIDDLRVFRRALDPATITAVYSGGTANTTLGVPGALQGAQQGLRSATAQAFSRVARNSYNPTGYPNPTTYSLECWFRTTGVAGAPRGQTIFSFSNKATTNTTSHDRRVFLDTAGHLVAGTASGVTGTATTTGTYFDGAWHHVVASVSPGTGIKLYADGILAAAAAYAAPANFSGFWRWGGDTWDASWPADYFWLGELDEVAVYPTALTAAQVAVHYHANH